MSNEDKALNICNQDPSIQGCPCILMAQKLKEGDDALIREFEMLRGDNQKLLDAWNDAHATWTTEKQAEESRLRNLRYYSSCAHPSKGILDDDSTQDRCVNAGFDTLYGWWKSKFIRRPVSEWESNLIWTGAEDMNKDCDGERQYLNKLIHI